MRPSLLWVAASAALGVSVAACSGGPKSPTVSAAGSQPITTAAGLVLDDQHTHTPAMLRARAYRRRSEKPIRAGKTGLR